MEERLEARLVEQLLIIVKHCPREYLMGRRALLSSRAEHGWRCLQAYKYS